MRAGTEVGGPGVGADERDDVLGGGRRIRKGPPFAGLGHGEDCFAFLGNESVQFMFPGGSPEEGASSGVAGVQEGHGSDGVTNDLHVFRA